VLRQYAVELPIQINLVTNTLELSLDSIQEALLNNEFFNVCDLASQILDALVKPDLGDISSFSGDLGNQNFQSVVELFGRWLEFVFDGHRVKLEKPNVGAGGEVALEVLLVELEQFHHVAQTFDLVLQALVDHDVDVELLVAPVDFQNRLEAS